MADQEPGFGERGDGLDPRATTVPLPSEEGDGEEVIAQQTVGPEVASGSGEWPSPQAPPTGPSPGTSPEGAQAASRREQASARPPDPGTSTQADQQQDATAGGDVGPARTADVGTGAGAEIDPPEGFKRVLGVDRVAGGSQSAPADEDQVDPSPG